MKKIVFLAVILIFIVLLFFIRNKNLKTPVNFISPLLRQEKILGTNQWLPEEEVTQGLDAPSITAQGAYFVDTKNGQVLYAKNPKQKLPIASLTKIMTVVIAMENKSMDDQFLVTQRAADMEPDKMLLIEGEKMTLKELLYGIFLISANDAAEVLAEGTIGNRAEFMEMMNQKARQLGMKDTYFVNPTGLDEDSNNSYSTVYDLAILSRYLIRNYPEVVEISKTPYIFIPQTKEHQSYEMWTGINLLTTYEGVVGFKTGYTPEAGYTIVTLARKNGQEILGVLLGSGYRRDETRNLLDYSFKKPGL